MESVALQIDNVDQLDQTLLALTTWRDQLSKDDRSEQVATVDQLIGKLNWDVAADELEVKA